ncbi:MAG: hexose kinase [Firmicutes bacterium]|nr:hexose kinase [Bacillota bacterium]
MYQIFIVFFYFSKENGKIIVEYNNIPAEREERPLILTVTLNPSIDHFVQSDNFTYGRLNRVKNLERQPGGKGVNIAFMLGVMGMETLATGFLGKAAGRFFQERLHKHKVTTNFVYIEDVTRHNYLLVDNIKNQRTLLDEEGPDIEHDEMKYFLETYRRLLPRCSAVVLAGSLPKKVPSGIYNDLIKMAEEHKLLTVLNTVEDNIAPCLNSGINIIMPDLRSSDKIMGIPVRNPENRNQVACSLLGKGGIMGIITFDSVNYLISTAHGCLEAKPAGVKMKNTLKTGDALIAGMIFEYLKSGSCIESVRTGVAASIASASHMNGFFKSYDEVKRHLDSVEIREVSS